MEAGNILCTYSEYANINNNQTVLGFNSLKPPNRMVLSSREKEKKKGGRKEGKKEGRKEGKE